MTTDDVFEAMQINELALEIARQMRPYEYGPSPHQIARALYLRGWSPPDVARSAGSD